MASLEATNVPKLPVRGRPEWHSRNANRFLLSAAIFSSLPSPLHSYLGGRAPESEHPPSYSPSNILFSPAAELCGFLLPSLEPLPSSSGLWKRGFQGVFNDLFPHVLSQRVSGHFPGPTIPLDSAGLGSLSCSVNIVHVFVMNFPNTSFWHGPSITTHWRSRGKSLHPPQDTLLAERGKSVRVRRLIMVRAMNETPGRVG